MMRFAGKNSFFQLRARDFSFYMNAYNGVVFHQLYRGNMTSNEMFAKIGDTLTMLTTGGADRG